MTNLNSDNCLRTLYARADALHARSKTAETHVSNKAATLVWWPSAFLAGNSNAITENTQIGIAHAGQPVRE